MATAHNGTSARVQLIKKRLDKKMMRQQLLLIGHKYAFQPVKAKFVYGNDIISIDPERQVKGIKPELIT